VVNGVVIQDYDGIKKGMVLRGLIECDCSLRTHLKCSEGYYIPKQYVKILTEENTPCPFLCLKKKDCKVKCAMYKDWAST
jgi:hypothetical protein